MRYCRDRIEYSNTTFIRYNIKTSNSQHNFQTSTTMYIPCSNLVNTHHTYETGCWEETNRICACVDYPPKPLYAAIPFKCILSAAPPVFAAWALRRSSSTSILASFFWLLGGMKRTRLPVIFQSGRQETPSSLSVFLSTRFCACITIRKTWIWWKYYIVLRVLAIVVEWLIEDKLWTCYESSRIADGRAVWWWDKLT